MNTTTMTAVPNDDADISLVAKHHLFVYEVDFGDEGKGRYVRLNDFNKVVSQFEAAKAKDGWLSPESAPISAPMEQVYFLASCPNDGWGAGGHTHIACRYGADAMCRPCGTNGERLFNGWLPIPKAIP